MEFEDVWVKKSRMTNAPESLVMKYYSGNNITLGDRVYYHNQEGCIALIGGESGSGSPLIIQTEWELKGGEVFVLFDNGGSLILDEVENDDLLVFCKRAGGI